MKTPRPAPLDETSALDDNPGAELHPAFLSIVRPPPPPGVSPDIWDLLTAMASALDQCAEGYWSAEMDTLIALKKFCDWEKQSFSAKPAEG